MDQISKKKNLFEMDKILKINFFIELDQISNMLLKSIQIKLVSMYIFFA